MMFTAVVHYFSGNVVFYHECICVSSTSCSWLLRLSLNAPQEFFYIPISDVKSVECVQ